MSDRKQFQKRCARAMGRGLQEMLKQLAEDDSGEPIPSFRLEAHVVHETGIMKVVSHYGEDAPRTDEAGEA